MELEEDTAHKRLLDLLALYSEAEAQNEKLEARVNADLTRLTDEMRDTYADANAQFEKLKGRVLATQMDLLGEMRDRYAEIFELQKKIEARARRRKTNRTSGARLKGWLASAVFGRL